MSVPEKLVEAVTDAVVAEWALFRAPRSGGTELVRSEYEEVVRTALAAAFAALPECEMEIRLPVGFEKSYADGWRDCLAALARDLGEPLLCDNCGKAMASHGALAECYSQPVEGGNVEDES